jgi:predicted metal-dependent peptidase
MDNEGLAAKPKLTASTMQRITDPALVQAAYSVIDGAFTAILMLEPVLSCIASEMHVVYTDSIPTAGVSRKGRQLFLWVNPVFVLENMRKDPTERHFAAIELGKHEVYHVLFEHLGGKRFSYTNDGWLHRMRNIAQDLAINSLLKRENFGKGWFYPGMDIGLATVGGNVPLQAWFKEVKLGLSSEAYLAELIQLVKACDPLSLKGTMFDPDFDLEGDYHDIEDEGSSEEGIILRERLRRRLFEGVEEARRTKRWGSIPVEMQAWLESCVSKEVDWASILNNFVGRISTKARTGQLMRTHRHSVALGRWVKPGTQTKETARIFLFVDESGSMGNEDISKAISEAANAAKETEVILVPFDTEIHWGKREVIKRGRKPTYQRVRCGGTDFQAVCDFLQAPEAVGCQAAVIVTDGYAGKVEGWPRLPILWLITDTGSTDVINSNHLVVHMDGAGTKKATIKD